MARKSLMTASRLVLARCQHNMRTAEQYVTACSRDRYELFTSISQISVSPKRWPSERLMASATSVMIVKSTTPSLNISFVSSLKDNVGEVDERCTPPGESRVKRPT